MAAADVFKEYRHTVSVYPELEHNFWLTAVNIAYKLLRFCQKVLKLIEILGQLYVFVSVDKMSTE